MAATGDGPPVIGWSGSHSTLPHLDALRPVLQELSRRRPFRLLVVGSPEYRIQGVESSSRPWRAERELEDLHEMDIGIMPLPSDPWTSLRSHLKVRQYMGVGLPSVASPIGVNRGLIQHGVNGYLAASEDEWLWCLTRLLDDPELRCDMGSKARTTIEECCSGEIWAGTVLQILNRVAARA
jgi:glycosyltransferase involved in cell wall biosynthesis